jgi:hypothetical protein
VTSKLRPAAWAIIVLGAAALALGGCGRKGPLDSPAVSGPPVAGVTAPPDSEAAAAAQPSVFNPSYGANAPPAAAKGTKKPFILDPLLGN